MPHAANIATITTRWNDNDQYGHLNNAVYYEVMDSAINSVLIEECGFDPLDSTVFAVCAESSCKYLLSTGYPATLKVTIEIERLGTSSVTWLLQIRSEGNDELNAVGRFVHVFVDSSSMRPIPIPTQLRASIAEKVPLAK